jgi:hypothetical protein
VGTGPISRIRIWTARAEKSIIVAQLKRERQTMPHKRQRKDRHAQESVAPLGTALLDDDADKDDDERKLESLLFGKPFVSAPGRRKEVTTIEDVKEGYGGADVATAELEGMLDSDVSYRLVLPR